MTRAAVSSDEAPAALGPYSQAIVAGGFVFCSGMAGIDPATGTIPEGVEAQTDQALVNLAAVLGAAGASMADVVKTTIFYADVEDFARLNEVYARHMPDPAPARSAQPTSGCPTACSSQSRRSRNCRAVGPRLGQVGIADLSECDKPSIDGCRVSREPTLTNGARRVAGRR